MNGVNINPYEIPHTARPINIKIQKTGLRVGESATFEIQRAEPRKDENGNIVYNALGKPEPKLNAAGEEDFSTWSKVVLTNKSDTDGALVVKTLLALDPSWVYKVTEDDWGWAYDTKGEGGVQTTSTVEVNPFKFVNTPNEKATKYKHAEAVTINHFATSATAGDAREEHYKSSKTDFKSTTESK